MKTFAARTRSQAAVEILAFASLAIEDAMYGDGALGESVASGTGWFSDGGGDRGVDGWLLWLSRKRRFAAALFVFRLERFGDSWASLKYFARSLHVERDSRTAASCGGAGEERI